MKTREIGRLSTALLVSMATLLAAGCGNDASPSGAGGQPSTVAAGAGGASCAPFSYDTTCGVCAKSACCAEYQKCATDSNCVCWVGCLATEPSSYPECAAQCGMPGALMESFSQCTNASCKPQCGDWTSTTSSASASTSASASSTSSTGSGGDPCAPVGADTTCTTCAKQKCCAEVTACQGDANCTCWIACSQKNPTNLGVCNMQCNTPDAKTMSLGTCTQKVCQGKCP